MTVRSIHASSPSVSVDIAFISTTRAMHPATNSATSSSSRSSSSVFHLKSRTGVDCPMGLNPRTDSGVSMAITTGSSTEAINSAAASSSSDLAVVHCALKMPWPSWCAPPMTRASVASLRLAWFNRASIAFASSSSAPSPKSRLPTMDAFIASDTAVCPKFTMDASSSGSTASDSSPKVTEETNSLAPATLPRPIFFGYVLRNTRGWRGIGEDVGPLGLLRLGLRRLTRGLHSCVLLRVHRGPVGEDVVALEAQPRSLADLSLGRRLRG
mmetsp:Transcript_4436/g.20142  ORF Transcript_4436/g.20142 Transcript_4436/m.20142 type:complete len:269 (+) Transcript_4436:137-943(+)